MTRYTKGQGQSHPLHHFVHHVVGALGLAAQCGAAALRHLTAGRVLIQLLLQHAGLHHGVVAIQRIRRNGDKLGLVLAGNGIRCGAGGPAGDIVQGAGTIGHCAVCRHFGGLKGKLHHVFLGDGVQIVRDLDIHGGAVHRDGGLGRGGGGELCRDLLIHLRNGQAVGAHLVAVHLQDDGGIAAAKAVVRIGKALGIVDDLHYLLGNGGQRFRILAVDLDRQAGGQLAGQIIGHAVQLDLSGAILDLGHCILHGLPGLFHLTGERLSLIIR